MRANPLRRQAGSVPTSTIASAATPEHTVVPFMDDLAWSELTGFGGQLTLVVKPRSGPLAVECFELGAVGSPPSR